MRTLFGICCLASSVYATITSAQAKTALGTSTGLKYAKGTAGKAMDVEIVGDPAGGEALIVLTMLDASAGGATAGDIGWCGIAAGKAMIGSDPLLAWQEGGIWKMSHRKTFTDYVDSGDAGASGSDFALVPDLSSKGGGATAFVAFTRNLKPGYTTTSADAAWTLDSLAMVGVRASAAPDSSSAIFPFHDLASASFVMAFSDFDGGSGGGDSSPAVSSGIVTSKKASATGGSTASADGDDSGSTASSTSGAASPSGSSKGGGTGSAQYVQGSSCQIKMDSPYAPYASFFQCSTAEKKESGKIANGLLLVLGITVLGLL